MRLLVFPVLIAIVLAWLVLRGGSVSEPPGPEPPQYNLRDLASLMMSRSDGRVNGKWPPYSGKAFVLALVADGSMHHRNTRALSRLFAPTQRPADFNALLDDYRRVTAESLRAGMDVRHLTSYAGRRNAEEAYGLTQASVDEGAAILADLLSIPGKAIVAFADGGVEILTRKDLGPGPDDPIVVGDASKSPILRALSDQ